VSEQLASLETTYKQQLVTLSTKLADLESGVETLNQQELSEQINTLTQQFERLEQQQRQPDESMSVKLAALETEVQQLTDALPSLKIDDTTDILQEKLVLLQAYVTDIGQQAFQSVKTLDSAQTDQAQRVAALSTKISELESTIKADHDQQLYQQLASLSQEVQELRQQQAPTYDDSALQQRLEALQTAQTEKIEQLATTNESMQLKLAALETELSGLTTALPASQKVSEVAHKLVEHGNALKTATEEQAQQIRQHRSQIVQLQIELGLLRTQSEEYPFVLPDAGPTMQDAALTEDQKAILAALLEKNALMEDIINYQSTALDVQKNRIQDIEARLEQMQGSQTLDEIAQRVPRKIESRGRITVVERKFRR
jgi:chromosome segregation ATPase